MNRFSFFSYGWLHRLSLLLLLGSSITCLASPQSRELYSRLNTANEKWVRLPYDSRVLNAGLPIYLAYDLGSIRNKNGISYVRTKYGNKDKDAVDYVLAAHCQKKRMVALALGANEENAAVVLPLWNNGRVRFSNPYDGGDYTIWQIPSDLPDVDKLFETICVSIPPSAR